VTFSFLPSFLPSFIHSFILFFAFPCPYFNCQLLLFSYSEKLGWIGAVTIDRNITFYSLKTFEKQKQIPGANDDIIDLKLLGKDDAFLAVASSSENVRIYSLQNFDCHIATGHKDVVICLDTNRDGNALPLT